MRALVMAGGEGRRLRPLTTNVPKSLLPIGGKPILQHILLRLQQFGVEDVTIAVAHLAPLIEKCFGSGADLDMRISYLYEESLLGTAGALSRFGNFNSSIVMMNGDILTDLNVAAMLAVHKSSQAVLTVASKMMPTDLGLGVLDLDENGFVRAYREKPRIEHRFGIGIYILEPAAAKFIQPGERIDMPDLINRLIAGGQTVATYEHKGAWIDIGTPEEYTRLVEESQLHIASGNGVNRQAAAAAVAPMVRSVSS